MSNLKHFIPSNIVPLGVDEQNEIVLWSVDKRRLFHRKLNDMSIHELVMIAGQQSVSEAEDLIFEEYGPKGAASSIIKRALAEESRERTFSTTETIGQGVWKVPGYGDRLLLVNGNRAYWYDRGNPNPWSVVPIPVVGKHLLDLGNNSWIDDQLLRQAIQEMDIQTVRDTFQSLVGYLKAWNFQQEDDYIILAGLILATCVQAYLDFRPQVWITGPTNAGKTAFKSLLSMIWPFAVEREGETSEAGIRQTVGSHSFPLLLDEQEAWHGRPRLVKTMRSATRGGVISKGTMTGKAIDFHLNHISWWFSIESDLPGAADRNRFSMFELVTQKDKLQFPTIPDIEQFSRKIVACSIWCAGNIKAAFRVLAGNESLSKHGRLVEVYALPVAIYGVVTGEDTTAMLDRIIEAQVKLIDTDSDERKLLDAILDAMPDKETFPISEFLNRKKKQFEQDPEFVLSRSGIRLGEKLNLKPGYVFLAADMIKKELLSKTPWGGRNVKQQLLRIEGAEPGRVQLWTNGIAANGVWVPRVKLGLPVAPTITIAPVLPKPALPAPVATQPVLPMTEEKYQAALKEVSNPVPIIQGVPLKLLPRPAGPGPADTKPAKPQVLAMPSRPPNPKKSKSVADITKRQPVKETHETKLSIPLSPSSGMTSEPLGPPWPPRAASTSTRLSEADEEELDRTVEELNKSPD